VCVIDKSAIDLGPTGKAMSAYGPKGRQSSSTARMDIKVLLKPTLLVVLGSHCLLAAVRPESVDIAVARVNGERIAKRSYDASRESLEKNLGKQFTGNKLREELAKREREILKALIDEEVLRQRARELGIVGETELIKSLDQMRRDKGFDDLESLERSLAAKGVDSSVTCSNGS
jgi:hypothetical protein